MFAARYTKKGLIIKTSLNRSNQSLLYRHFVEIVLNFVQKGEVTLYDIDSKLHELMREAFIKFKISWPNDTTIVKMVTAIWSLCRLNSKCYHLCIDIRKRIPTEKDKNNTKLYEAEHHRSKTNHRLYIVCALLKKKHA